VLLGVSLLGLLSQVQMAEFLSASLPIKKGQVGGHSIGVARASAYVKEMFFRRADKIRACTKGGELAISEKVSMLGLAVSLDPKTQSLLRQIGRRCTIRPQDVGSLLMLGVRWQIHTLPLALGHDCH
jgi:hypothetical protein